MARRPRVLSKTQIRDVLWPGTTVGETSLPRLVTELRQALGDDVRQPRFIRTAHGFGYAFCGEAHEEGAGPTKAIDPDPESPYPGLLSFTEADADRFFGREAEVATLWGRLRQRKLLAVIGASGAGKTSFVRAGVVASRPEGWGAIVATPGTSPLHGLGRVLGPQLASDPEALGKLVAFEDADTAFELLVRWRLANADALLVVDQFEELFTLNPPEVQSRFAALLGRLSAEGDLHVLLSLRDDFLMRCHEHEALAPVFGELTPLGPPTTQGLRRAVIEPARAQGYRFEHEGLVDEMVEAVAGGRGALPLLAFAVSRLWERRDRERTLLTRGAYEEIGGVAGALAQHAEATLERIGPQDEGMVREVFRNLTTAQGTRGVLDAEELLSALPDRVQAEGVLGQLVDARLLTSYETDGSEPESSRHRVEIVHESLLTAWPRLVRWQTQDKGGAQLRDQLRQAARLWDERGRPEDLLWAGTSYLEYLVWRDRYPGGLSSLEERFAQAMTSLATRRRRRRRIAVAAVVAALSVGLAVVGVFWSRSETARRHAGAEALRAEAAKLLALGQLELDRYPTATVAYALKSLELADTKEARLLALRALQRGPTAILAPGMQEPGLELFALDFSPNGEWLALGGFLKAHLRHRDGGAPAVLRYEHGGGDGVVSPRFGQGDLLVTDHNGDVRGWSVPGGVERWRAQPETGASGLWRGGDQLFTSTSVGSRGIVRRWSASGASQVVGTMDIPGALDGTGRWLAYARGREVYLRSLEEWTSPPRLIGKHPDDVRVLAFRSDATELAASDNSGEIRLWPVAVSGRPRRVLAGPETPEIAYDPTGRWFAASGSPGDRPITRLWDLTAPPDAAPLIMRRSDVALRAGVTFDPTGRWMATADVNDAALWPLPLRQARVLSGSAEKIRSLAFTPDGGTIVSLSDLGEVRVWPLSPSSPEGSHALFRGAVFGDGWLTIDPHGKRIAIPPSGHSNGPTVVPLGGGPVRTLSGFPETAGVNTFTFSEDGRRLAAAPYAGTAQAKVIRIYDLDTGECQVVGPVPGAGEGFAGGINSLTFLDREHLIAGAQEVGLILFDLRDGNARLLTHEVEVIRGLSRTRRFGIGTRVKSRSPWHIEVVRFDLDDWKARPLTAHGDLIATRSAALDPTETLVASASEDGTVRIGPVDGGEPHYFFGHESYVTDLAFSPDGRWLASAGSDKTIRLWPVPDAAERPFHMLPREELLAKLRALTNLRAVLAPGTASGYKTETGPFPGWAKVPEW